MVFRIGCFSDFLVSANKHFIKPDENVKEIFKWPRAQVASIKHYEISTLILT